MKWPKGRFAGNVTVGTKGQIVIPKEARVMFGIEPGDTLLLLADEKRGIAIPPPSTIAAVTDTIFGSEVKENGDS
ncbi:MAG: AbrB/MazE/SpoVT family DNA-binding domain-containing protein [Oscillospiraceae bacterium]|nr:AbrB/MazE/SpoVT family DNA-binding domain-containing protein [Oscillospiraceae bacterium]